MLDAFWSVIDLNPVGEVGICSLRSHIPNLVSALTGHVEGSRAFTRYRTIDIDMKKDLVKILEGKQ